MYCRHSKVVKTANRMAARRLIEGAPVGKIAPAA